MEVTTRELARTLLASFSKNDGVGNFGFVLSMYEWDKKDELYKTETVIMAVDPGAVEVMAEEINKVMNNMGFEGFDDDDFEDFDEDDRAHLN